LVLDVDDPGRAAAINGGRGEIGLLGTLPERDAGRDALGLGPSAEVTVGFAIGQVIAS
jgi:hypothetical protein